MRGVLFLFSALFLLELTKGEKYEELNEHDREIVDMAIQQGNEGLKNAKHLDFYEIRDRTENAVNVILRPTSCDKTTPSVHRKQCQTSDMKPQLACIFCGTTMKQCLPLRSENEIKKKRDECHNPASVGDSRTHLLGSAHSMYRTGNGQQLTGCLGCI